MAKIRIGTSVQLSLVFLALACFLNYVGAYSFIKTTAKCNQCLNRSDVVCRSRHDIGMSFCCDPGSKLHKCTSEPDIDDLEDKTHGQNFEICSNELPEESMRAFTCPFQESICGQDFPEVYLDPVNSNVTYISSSSSGFSGGEACYYNLIAENVTDHPELDYQIDVNITRAEGLTIHVMNGTELSSSGDVQTVNLRSQEPQFLTFNASLLPMSGRPNQLFITLTTDKLYKQQPRFMIEFSLSTINRTEVALNADTGPGVTLIEEDSALLAISNTLTDYMLTSKQLTLNEKIVMFPIMACLLVSMIKARMCPVSWSQENSSARKKLVAYQLAKSAFNEIEPEADDDQKEEEGVVGKSKISEILMVAKIRDANRKMRIKGLAKEMESISHLWTYEAVPAGGYERPRMPLNLLVDSKVKGDSVISKQYARYLPNLPPKATKRDAYEKDSVESSSNDSYDEEEQQLLDQVSELMRISEDLDSQIRELQNPGQPKQQKPEPRKTHISMASNQLTEQNDSDLQEEASLLEKLKQRLASNAETPRQTQPSGLALERVNDLKDSIQLDPRSNVMTAEGVMRVHRIKKDEPVRKSKSIANAGLTQNFSLISQADGGAGTERKLETPLQNNLMSQSKGL